ncbi:MAG: acetoin utilization protein AcuC [Gammaproteobacteria bacterium]|nr:acetoin utilization protein AcuC [Gammaproteobacteria bacterium]
MCKELIVYDDVSLSQYSFGNKHPFGPARYDAFNREFIAQGLNKLCAHGKAILASDQQITLFHTTQYLQHLITLSAGGEGYLDCGDTPAFKGIYQAASRVAGSTLDAVDKIMAVDYKRAFIPIAGLHHAARDKAAGFCALNDCGIAIEYLRKQYAIKKIAYIDIDAHHADGVFYAFETDPDLQFADIHEDGIYLYPGTGHFNETGKAAAAGSKLNLPVPVNADDERFNIEWQKIEHYLALRQPEFILFQCGADSIKNDPITDLNFTPRSHALAARRLKKIADQYASGRLLAMGGGGYNLNNIANTWCAVVKALI